jgi:hypothetical protein
VEVLIRHVVGIFFIYLLHKKQYLWQVSQKSINVEVLIRHTAIPYGTVADLIRERSLD